MENIQISAKVIGKMSMPDFCPRCFWIGLKCKPLPWQIFPGIFSSIDAYTKKIVHAWIDRKDGKPDFIRDLNVTGYMKVPHWSKFKMETEYGIILSGAPDDLLVSPRGIHIPDYKTAKFTATQDKLFPMYQAQVNGYAKIGIHLNMDIDSLSLIYMEPMTDETAAAAHNHTGCFDMRFVPNFLKIKMDIDSIDPLLERARAIYDGPIPDLTECKDCAALTEIIGII